MLLFLAFLSSFWLSASNASEWTMHLDYDVKCDLSKTDSFPGITGEIKLDNRTLRFQLFKYQHQIELSLGASQPLSNEIYFYPSDACTLQSLSSSIQEEAPTEELSALAYQHSPYLVLRGDQMSRPTRDVPLGITYSIIPDGDFFSIRYTYFFSNETVHGPFETTKPMSLGMYGRRTDVEWIYEVTFDQNQKVVARHYQGGVLAGIGHKTHRFRGRYLKGTHHPVLYDIAKHNVFGDHPAPGIQHYRKTGYHLIPREEIKAPEAREMWMWKHPWTFDVSDRELARTGELSARSHEYLYPLISGSLNGGNVKIMAQSEGSGALIPAGEGRSILKKLGEDLFSKETFTAISLGENFLSRHGRVWFQRSSENVTLETPRFFQLIPDTDQGFIAEEVSSRFQCISSYECWY